VPAISTVTDRQGRTRTTLPDGLLGVEPDSAELPIEAAGIIIEVAGPIMSALADRPDVLVTVTSFTADLPGSTAADRKLLATQRAQAVADALQSAGVRNPITAAAGTDPGSTAVLEGEFVERNAEPMRRVEISY